MNIMSITAAGLWPVPLGTSCTWSSIANISIVGCNWCIWVRADLHFEMICMSFTHAFFFINIWKVSLICFKKMGGIHMVCQGWMPTVNVLHQGSHCTLFQSSKDLHACNSVVDPLTQVPLSEFPTHSEWAAAWGEAFLSTISESFVWASRSRSSKCCLFVRKVTWYDRTNP